MNYFFSGALVCSVMAACHPSANPTPSVAVGVHCVPAVQVTLRDLRTLRGTVVAAPGYDAVIAPQIPGRLLKVARREGECIRRGEVVAEVESQPTQDALLKAEANMRQAECAAQNADVTATRTTQLFAEGLIPRQQVDDSQARFTAAVATVDSARASVDVAARRVAWARVRSPMDGVIVRIMRHAGELVDGTYATPVMEIADPKMLEFLATASPRDLIALRQGQPAAAHFDALSGDTFSLKVRAVAPSVDLTTGVGSVRLSLLDSTARPPLGLFGVTTVDVGASRLAIVVPPGVLRNAWAGGTEVVVCDRGRARIRTVEVGVRSSDQAEILHGLLLGDRVVADEVIGLTDGAPITESP
jgi:RND family efflux transporter MFP subunit